MSEDRHEHVDHELFFFRAPFVVAAFLFSERRMLREDIGLGRPAVRRKKRRAVSRAVSCVHSMVLWKSCGTWH